jgi:polyribonucleotide nucleotidyltransferase
MGLVKEGSNYGILTDIAGAEDHYGDMDFQSCRNPRGITALRWISDSGRDFKDHGEALDQAKRGRLFILDKMREAISEVKRKCRFMLLASYTMKIPTDKIRDVIGPGGKMIRSIIEQTGVKIDVSDDGRVNIASSDGPSAQKPFRSFPI